MSHNIMPHFPIPSLQRDEASKPGHNKSSEKLRGKQFPSPIDGQVSLSAVFSNCLLKRDFSCESCSIIQDGQMGLTFRQLDVMARRVARIIGSKISLINLGDKDKEALTNSDGDSVIALLSEGSQIDEKIIVFILAILKLGATFVNIQVSRMNASDWKWAIKQIQPLIVIMTDTTEVPEMVANTQVVCSVGKVKKSKVKLPHQIWTAKELWDQAVKLNVEEGNDIHVTPLKSKVNLGERIAGIFCVPCVPFRKTNFVRIGHKSVLNRILWEKNEFPVQDQEKLYLTYPTSEPKFLIQLFTPLLQGKPVYILDPSMFLNPEFLLTQITSWKIFRLNINPKQLEHLLDHVESTGTQKDLHTVRFWMVSGGYFSLELGRKFFKTLEDNKCLLTVFYGCPELLWSATWWAYPSLKDLEKMSFNGCICVGVPLHNTCIYIIDDKDWSDCRLGVKGEIYISGGSLGDGGYAGQMMKTNPGAVIETGDLGRIIIDNNGNKVLIYEGSINSRIKIQNQTVDLIETAQLIVKKGYAVQCVLFQNNVARDSQRLVAAYVPELMPDGTPAWKQSKLEERVKAIEPLISDYIELKTIPRLADGRFDNKELRKQYHKYLTTCANAMWNKLGINSTELKLAGKVLCKSVASSLGIKVKTVIDNYNKSFWSLGGSSTKAVKCMHAVQSQGFNLIPEDFALSGRLDSLTDRMILCQRHNAIWKKSIEDTRSKFAYSDLNVKHWKEVLKLIKKDFDVRLFGQPFGLQRFWRAIFDEILHQRMSSVATIEGRVVGVALNSKEIPFLTGTPVEIDMSLRLFQEITSACRPNLPSNFSGKIAYSFYIAFDEMFLTPAQRILIIRELLEKSAEFTRKTGCSSFILCTANPLIQEISTLLLKYGVLAEHPLNRYKTRDFHKPFWNADDDQKVGVYFKLFPATNKQMMELVESKSLKNNKPKSKHNDNIPVKDINGNIIM